MGKLGKVMAPAMVIMAICTAVASFFLMVQGKKYRYRSQILAKSLAETAKRLDSGSGEAKNVTFSVDAGTGNEDGSLAWKEAAKESVDLSADGNSYAATAEKVAKLATDVVEQRDAIVDKISGIAKSMGAPEKSMPNAESLKNVSAYEDGLNDFQSYINARVARDNYLRGSINAMLPMFGVSGRYSAAITTDGKLTPQDAKLFDDVKQRVQNSRVILNNYQAFARDLARTLHGSRVDGVKWNAVSHGNAGAYNVNGFNLQGKATADNTLAALKKDLVELQKQLRRINELLKDIDRSKATINAQTDTIRKLEKKIKENEQVISSYFKQGLGVTIAENRGAAKSSMDEVEENLSGKIITVDSNTGIVVLNLSKHQVVPGVLFMVHRSGEYRGMVRVTKVGEFNSVAEVVMAENGGIADGDAVLRSKKVIQEVVK